MNQARLAILMTCFNRRDTTLRALRALALQQGLEGIQIDVFLVDDGSTDGTAAAIAQEFPKVQVLKGDGGLFWNRGMHLAFANALTGNYDFYLWLNDDSILYPHALQTLLNTSAQLHQAGHREAIIGSAMQDAATHMHSYGGIRKHRNWWGRVWQTKLEPSERPQQCDATNGNCVLIPRAVTAKIGNLDPVFRHRWGDHDYCFRAIKAGCSVWLAPGYLGTCSRNPISGTWEDLSLGFGERIKKVMSHKAMHPKDYVVYLRRHRGPFWAIHWLWPYFKITLQSLKFMTQRKTKTVGQSS